MIDFPDRIRSLADLIDLRAALRRQVSLLSTSLRDVQAELRGWLRHRRASDFAGQPVPRELRILWDELESREREMVLDLVQARAALAEASAEIDAHLRRQRPAHRAG